ncbi:hypothetical protein [Marinagarivorans algicola]|uniref:hypothetical protein n=1 Tax=Marinagarivorans algicola TaxID=1513270 RepID=UPI0006B9D29E|nr:hypothetical protein [Marinagarivorans algicola]
MLHIKVPSKNTAMLAVVAAIFGCAAGTTIGCSAPSTATAPSSTKPLEATHAAPSGTYSARPSGYQPAVLIASGEKVRGELVRTMVRMAKKDIQLPSDAFTQTSSVILGHHTPPSLGAPQGLMIEHVMPYRFELLTHADHCYLYYANKADLKKLSESQCRAITQ